MPLPNYGHENMEKKTHQDIVFEMAPEIVSDEEVTEIINGQKVKRKRGKVTTGKLGIDLERTIVINEEKDPNIWKTEINEKDIEDARKFSNPQRAVLKKDVRSALDSLISGNKARSIKDSPRPSINDLSRSPSAEIQKNLRFALPENARQVEQNVTGVSIQPSGTYSLSRQNRSISSSPRSSPDPAQNISIRVDQRYNDAAGPVRQSLTQAYHAKTSGKTQNTPAYSMSQVSETRTFKTHGIRSLD